MKSTTNILLLFVICGGVVRGLHPARARGWRKRDKCNKACANGNEISFKAWAEAKPLCFVLIISYQIAHTAHVVLSTACCRCLTGVKIHNFVLDAWIAQES